MIPSLEITTKPLGSQLTILHPFYLEGTNKYFDRNTQVFQVWVCLFCLWDFSQHCYLKTIECLNNWHRITLCATRKPTHSKRGVVLRPWPWNVPLTLQTASSRTRRPVWTLEWPVKGTAEVPVERQYFTVITLHNITLQYLLEHSTLNHFRAPLGSFLHTRQEEASLSSRGNCSWSSLDRTMEKQWEK